MSIACRFAIHDYDKWAHVRNVTIVDEFDDVIGGEAVYVRVCKRCGRPKTRRVKT